MTEFYNLLNTYEQSVNGNDLSIANKLWLDSDEISFIHPRGHEIGKKDIIKGFYIETMQNNFIERKLKINKDSIVMNQFNDTLIVSFYWEFDAVFRDSLESKHTEGRETQVFINKEARWYLAHVHYSSMPVTAEGEGF